MGVGKSTVSNALQNTFAMDVVEMDEMIAKKNNMSISEIFDLHGEAYFRNEETNLLKEVGKEKIRLYPAAAVWRCGRSMYRRCERAARLYF